MAPERRADLVAWANRADRLIVEDDYDAEFRYDRNAIGAIQGLDPCRVIHIGTASKTLAPGIRLGWMSLPDTLIDEVRAAKDRSTPVRRRSSSSRSPSSSTAATTTATWRGHARSTGSGATR